MEQKLEHTKQCPQPVKFGGLLCTEIITKNMVGVTVLEPKASGVTARYLRVIRGNMVAFVLNIAHRLPSIPTQFCMQNVCTR